MMKTRSARNEPAAAARVLVDADWLDAHRHDPAVRVVEVDVSRRAHDEWHIEGAALRSVFSATDLDGGDELITYCTIGGRACTAWFVLAYLLGRERVRVYDGSWAEWGRMPEASVEQA
jgi:3-mercaptopyruvate sulfurtransferase SseA